MNTLQYILDKFNLKMGNEMPIRIPNVSRKHIPLWINELGFKTGVEVGVHKGRFLRQLCFSNPGMFFYGVDPMKPSEGYIELTKQSDFDIVNKDIKYYMEGYPNHEMILELSMDAVKRFKDDSIDFVYIDANHQDPYVTQDIAEWTRRVRSGGIVSGHDYTERSHDRRHPCEYDVIGAIDKYTTERNIPLFVLGADDPAKGTIRDFSRSWMFVKP